MRNPSGLYSLDENGDVRLNANGNPKLSQRGEIISLEYYSSTNARLLLANRTRRAGRWDLADLAKPPLMSDADRGARVVPLVRGLASRVSTSSTQDGLS